MKYASALSSVAQKRKAHTAPSWRLDETYVKVRGEWCYLYRAVHRAGQALDFTLSEYRNEAAALRFPIKIVQSNGLPKAFGIDLSGANTAALNDLNGAFHDVGAPVECGSNAPSISTTWSSSTLAALRGVTDR